MIGFKKMWLRRYDLKNILKKIWFWKLMTWLSRKDMIQTLNLSQQKRQHTWNVESNHQLVASIFEKRKKLNLKEIWLKRYDLKKIWFWKSLKTEKNLH